MAPTGDDAPRLTGSRRLAQRVREARTRFRRESGQAPRFFRDVPGPAERDEALQRVAPALRDERLRAGGG